MQHRDAIFATPYAHAVPDRGVSSSSPNAAVELIKGNLERHPDQVAYFCGELALTYRGLDLASRRFAQLLRTLWNVPRERVVIALPDCFAFPVVFLVSSWPVQSPLQPAPPMVQVSGPFPVPG